MCIFFASLYLAEMWEISHKSVRRVTSTRKRFDAASAVRASNAVRRARTAGFTARKLPESLCGSTADTENLV